MDGFRVYRAQHPQPRPGRARRSVLMHSAMGPGRRRSGAALTRVPCGGFWAPGAVRLWRGIRHAATLHGRAQQLQTRGLDWPVHGLLLTVTRLKPNGLNSAA